MATRTLSLPALPSAMLAPVLSTETLAKNLQAILAALTPIEDEPRAEGRYLFDLIAAAVVSPHLLHHKQTKIKSCVLACLREIVRISSLEATTDDALPSPSLAKNPHQRTKWPHSPETSSPREDAVAPSAGEDWKKSTGGRRGTKGTPATSPKSADEKRKAEVDATPSSPRGREWTERKSSSGGSEGEAPTSFDSSRRSSGEADGLGLYPRRNSLASSQGRKSSGDSDEGGAASNGGPSSIGLQMVSASGGQMGALFREKDWAQTVLGPQTAWPQSLKIALGILFYSRFQMVLWWGPEFIMFYNDHYREILGPMKHPFFFGKPGQECFPEIWHIIGPMLEYVRTTGDATWVDDQLLLMNRAGYLQESYFTYSYSPIFLDDGSIGGVFCAVSETTETIINERQLRTLRQIAAHSVEAVGAANALSICAKTIESHSQHDLPFANLYILEEDGRVATLAETVGCVPGSRLCPTSVKLQNERKQPETEEESEPMGTDFWRDTFNRLIEQGTDIELSLEVFGDEVPECGHWQVRPRDCVVLPIASQTGSDKLVGIVVAGVNQRHALDEHYRLFLKLLANGIASAVAHASAREEEQKRVESLAELDRAKTTFFSNISHEFRTPLTLMLGPLEDLLELPSVQYKEQLQLIHRNSLRLLKLVNSLLDFSRIEAGKTHATFEATNLSQFTEELASIFRTAVENAGMKLIVDCPPLTTEAYVDREMWEKILLNLLSNALKFTMEGQIEVHLTQISDTEAELRVTDTGIGIPKEELHNVGKRFHRFTSAGGRSHEGTGIGLALVFELARLHGGSASVESEKGKGSTFRIRIPLGCAHLPPAQVKKPKPSVAQLAGNNHQLDVQESAHDMRTRKYAQSASWWLPSLEIVSSPSSSSSSSFTSSSSTALHPLLPQLNPPVQYAERRFKVLLADDNFDMREYVARLLAERYEVVAVANGVEALEVVKRQTVDLIITDVMMPCMDGFSLLRELRARNETKMIPVILLSARAGEESKVEGLEAGADDYLIKPFTARELLARVSSQLDMVRMRSEAARREQELRFQVNEAKERLERIISSIQDAFVSLDRNLRYTFVNDNAALILGARKEDMLGRDVWDFMPDTDDRVVRNNLERAIRQQVDVSFEFYHPQKDRWFEHRIYPSTEGVSIFTLDITSRKKSEERLSVLGKIGQLLASSIDCHLPSLLASILKIAAGSVVADWCVLDIVEERGMLERIATPSALAHKWKITKIPWEQRVDPKKYYMVVELCTGDRIGVESTLSPKDDSFIAFPLAARGKVFGIWLFARTKPLTRAYREEDKAVCEELSRRAALAIDNIRLYQDAESANQAKDHFLAALSHELRTPLTPALMLSEALLGEHLPPNITENIKTIHESVELEVQLIDDLLDLTKIARGKLQLHTQEVSVHELLGRTLQIVTHDIESKKLQVGVDPCAAGDRLVADPARLQQVFWNIIKNAIKFTPEGGSIVIRTSNFEIEEEVEDEPESMPLQTATEAPLSAESGDAPKPRKASTGKGGGITRRKHTRKKVMLRVEVQDTGIGIESHVIPHLFHAFEQGDASITLCFGGLGLGLAISRSLVEMHNGLLAADSEGRGRGATFTVTLPTVHSSISSLQLANGAQAASAAAVSGERKQLVGPPEVSVAEQRRAQFAQQPTSAAVRKAAMSPSFTLSSLSKMRRERDADVAGKEASRRPSSTPPSPQTQSPVNSPTTPVTRPSSQTAPEAVSSSSTTPTTSPPSSNAVHPGLQPFLMGAQRAGTNRTTPSSGAPSPSHGPTSPPSNPPAYPIPPAFCVRSRSTPILPSATGVSSSLISATLSPLRPAASIRPLKVLLVEDNKSTLLIMSRLLQQRLGYNVLVASTVKDAKEVAEREDGKFDLVISDIGLPDGTGLQLMKVLREKYRLKGIALSGYGMEEDIKRSKNAGFEVHLTKPVNFSSLTAAIHRVIPPHTPPSSPTIAPSASTSPGRSVPSPLVPIIAPPSSPARSRSPPPSGV